MRELNLTCLNFVPNFLPAASIFSSDNLQSLLWVPRSIIFKVFLNCIQIACGASRRVFKNGFGAPYLKKYPPDDFAHPGDHLLGRHLALLLRTHNRDPDNLVTASTWRNHQRINDNLNWCHKKIQLRLRCHLFSPMIFSKSNKKNFKAYLKIPARQSLLNGP